MPIEPSIYADALNEGDVISHETMQELSDEDMKRVWIRLSARGLEPKPLAGGGYRVERADCALP